MSYPGTPAGQPQSPLTRNTPVPSAPSLSTLGRHGRRLGITTRKQSVSVGLEPAATNASQLAGSAEVQSARVRCTPQFQHSWSVVPTRVPKHRAQCASDGRRARRLAEVRAEPLPASLRRHSCAAGRDEQTSCQSRRAAARPAARKQLLLPPRCRRASTSSNASARARPPGSSRAQTSRLACQPPLFAARRGAFSNMKSFLAGDRNFQIGRFNSL